MVCDKLDKRREPVYYCEDCGLLFELMGVLRHTVQEKTVEVI